MRTIRIKLYKFSELSKDAKEKAIQECQDFNVNYDWWESTYEDAKTAGLKITSFDLDRNRHAKGEFIEDALNCAHKIMDNHGEQCETYKTAKTFLEERDAITERYKEDIENDDFYEVDKEYDELEDEFLKSVLEDYSIMLQKECEYLQSEEAIIDTIEANEYEFTKDGKLN